LDDGVAQQSLSQKIPIIHTQLAFNKIQILALQPAYPVQAQGARIYQQPFRPGITAGAGLDNETIDG
jgi:hypothetical protein